MNLYYLPYHSKSGSVRAIQDVLGGLKIKHTNGNYAFKPKDLVVNWGHGSTPYWGNAVNPNPRLLNHWSSVSTAVNKLSAFKKFKEKNVPTPAWTTSKEEATEWVTAGRVVICRTKLSSMEGRGIVVAQTVDQLVDAPLYTKLFVKDKEYRVHIFKGDVIDYVQKKLRNDAPQNRSKYIRNTANGWIFARTAVSLPPVCIKAAKDAVAALALDFGAVDLAVSGNGTVVVFEVNTAPGLEGTTITRYTDAITNYQSQIQNV